MHISFDVDGVLANFPAGFSRVLKNLYNLDLDVSDIKTWNWSDWADGLTHDMESGAWDAIMRDSRYWDFWIQLPPLCWPNDVARINELSKRNIVSFITNRQAKDQHVEVARVTQQWLSTRGLRSSANVFLAARNEKGLWGRRLGTHLVIEDNGDNCLDYLDAGVGTAMLRRPYNEGFVDLVAARGGYIIDSLDDFLTLCESFDGQQDDALRMSNTVRSQNVLWNNHSIPERSFS